MKVVFSETTTGIRQQFPLSWVSSAEGVYTIKVKLLKYRLKKKLNIVVSLGITKLGQGTGNASFIIERFFSIHFTVERRYNEPKDNIVLGSNERYFLPH